MCEIFKLLPNWSFHVKCGFRCLQCMNYCCFALDQNSIRWFVFFNYRHKSHFFHINFKIMKQILNNEFRKGNKADTPKILCPQEVFYCYYMKICKKKKKKKI